MDKLFQNDAQTLRDVSEILLKFANNILNNPDNEKYRRIRVGNAIVSTRLLPVSGAMECLFDMGFVEVCAVDHAPLLVLELHYTVHVYCWSFIILQDGEYLTYPMRTDLKGLTIFRNIFLSRLQKHKGLNSIWTLFGIF